LVVFTQFQYLFLKTALKFKIYDQNNFYLKKNQKTKLHTIFSFITVKPQLYIIIFQDDTKNDTLTQNSLVILYNILQ